jgi:branched-chain amino acid transport system substrate-binding protein
MRNTGKHGWAWSTGRRTFIGTALAVAALFGAPAVQAQQGVTAGEIVIGALGPLTGPFAFIGAPARDSMALAIDKINEAGGLNGRKLKLVFEHANTPAESVAAAKKLVEESKVFALVLASGSTGAAAAADYVRAANIPTYNIYGATPIIRTPFAKNIFHSAIPGAETSGKALIDEAFRAVPGTKKLGILAGTYAFPQSHLKTMREQLATRTGVEVVVEQFDAAARDYTAQLLSFARQKVDAIIVLGSYTEAGFAIKQAPEKGLPASMTWILDGSGVNDGIVAIVGPENTKNLHGYYNVPFFPTQVDDAPMAGFRKLWIAKYGTPPAGRPNLYDLVGYGSTYVLAQAIKGAGANLTWDSLVASWEKVSEAKPSALGGFDVIYPETFSATDHQGGRRLGSASIVGDKWKVVR